MDIMHEELLATMGLKEQTYLTSYNKAEHDIADMFYLPCMRLLVIMTEFQDILEASIYIIKLGKLYGSLLRTTVRCG